MASSSNSGLAHPPRSIPGSSSSFRPPFACITPSTETCVLVVSFMVAAPSRWLFSSAASFVWQQPKQRREERRDDAGGRIRAIGVVDRAVPHREHAPAGAHGKGRLEVRRTDVLAVVAQTL